MCNGKCNRVSEVVYKCEEIRVSCFSKSSDVFDPFVLNGKQIEKILSWKVIGRSQIEKKTGKPFIAEMLLRICVWISSCSWKAPSSLHTSRSVLYVRSLNTLARFLTNHYLSNSLRNRSFSYFRSLSNFLDELTRKHLLPNLPKYLSDALLFLIDISYS